MRLRAHSAAVMAACLFALVSPARSGAAPDPAWLTWNAGLQQAAAARRPVLVDVYTDWCGWCKRMDHDVYLRSDVREYLSHHFVTVRLNAESAEGASYAGHAYTGRTLAMRFGVSGYPTTIFLRANGEHLVNVPGYVPADQFLQLLRYIGEGHMDRGESFEAFQHAAGPAH
jgi:thioredoxin-related protein